MTQSLTLDGLLQMGRSGDVVRFIDVASTAAVRGIPHDELRVMLIRRLAELGLLHRAADVANGLSGPVKASPDFATLRQSLRQPGSDGLRPWDTLRSRYEANLDVLLRRYGWADAMHAAWLAEQRHLELHVTKDGRQQVFDRRSGWRPVFGNLVPQPSADVFAKQIKDHIIPAFVIDGIGLGFHLPWVHEATSRAFLGATALIYQVERSFVGMAVALHLNDWRGLITDARVRLCCGPDAYEHFAEWVANDTTNHAPQGIVTAPGWETADGQTVHEWIEKASQELEDRRVALHAEASETYAGRDRAWWHRRFTEALSGGPPLRVLGVTCRFSTVLQYSMRDALNAFAANGCETRLVMEPDNHSRITPLTLLSTIREFEPDLLIVIDHLRERQRPGLIDNLPLVTWIQDRLPWLFTAEAGASMGPLDFCMGYSRPELVRRFGYPANQFMPCLMATDPAALLPPEAKGKNLAALEAIDPPDPALCCDVAFATNRGRSAEDIHEDSRKRCEPQLQPLVDAVYEEVLARLHRGELNGGLDFGRMLLLMGRERGMELSPDQRETIGSDYVWPLVDHLIRRQTIQWAAAWAESTGGRFSLYGHGWDTHPEFARYARGFIEHGPQLGRAIRAAKVNLHAGCNNALHQRVLDGLAAGGFFLIRRHYGDVFFRVMLDLYAYVREQGFEPGAKVRLEDFPSPLRERLIATKRMRGVALTEYEPLLQINFDSMQKLWEQREKAENASRLWPDFDRVTFDSADEFSARMREFLTDEGARRSVAFEMREAVLREMSHDVLMKQLLHWLRETLGRNTQ